MTDRSSWQDFGNHQFLLAELRPESKPDYPHRKFIIRYKIKHSGALLQWNFQHETEQPRETDCPMRLLNAADEFPPANQAARRWRQQVRDFHRRLRPLRNLMDQLAREYPNGDRRIVLRSGKTVSYERTRQSGRTTSTYRNKGEQQRYRLSRKQIDIEATLQLRNAGTGEEIEGERE